MILKLTRLIFTKQKTVTPKKRDMKVCQTQLLKARNQKSKNPFFAFTLLDLHLEPFYVSFFADKENEF